MSQTAHHKQRLPLSFKLLYALPVLAAGIPALAQAEAPASVSHTKHAAASKTAKKHVTGATASTPSPASVQAGAPTVITKTGSAKHTISQARGTAEEAGKPESVTVIGSLFKDPNLKSMSPITHISRQDMQRRGFANVTDALQSLSSNGAGTLTLQLHFVS